MAFTSPDYIRLRQGSLVQPSVFSTSTIRRCSSASPSSMLDDSLQSGAATRQVRIAATGHPASDRVSTTSAAFQSRSGAPHPSPSFIASDASSSIRSESSDRGDRGASLLQPPHHARQRAPSLFNSSFFAENAHTAIILQSPQRRKSRVDNFLDFSGGGVDARAHYIPLPSGIKWTTHISVAPFAFANATRNASPISTGAACETNEGQHVPKADDGSLAVATGCTCQNAVVCIGDTRACVIRRPPTSAAAGGTTGLIDVCVMEDGEVKLSAGVAKIDGSRRGEHSIDDGLPPRIQGDFDAAFAENCVSATANVASCLVMTSLVAHRSTATMFRSPSSGKIWLVSSGNGFTADDVDKHLERQAWARRPTVSGSALTPSGTERLSEQPPWERRDVAPEVTVVPIIGGVDANVRTVLPGFEGVALCGGTTPNTVYAIGGFAQEIVYGGGNSTGRMVFNRDVIKISLDDANVNLGTSSLGAVDGVSARASLVRNASAVPAPGLAHHSAVMVGPATILCFGGFVMGSPAKKPPLSVANVTRDRPLGGRSPLRTTPPPQVEVLGTAAASDPDVGDDSVKERKNSARSHREGSGAAPVIVPYDGLACALHGAMDNIRSECTLLQASPTGHSSSSGPFELCCGNGVYEFDAAARSWRHIVTVGEVPSARAHHTATIYGPWMIVVGGMSFGDDGNESTELSSTLSLRSTSNVAAARRRQLLWGRCDEVFMLHTALHLWIRVESCAHAPLPAVAHHLTMMTPTEIVVVGEHGVSRASAAAFIRYANTKRRIVNQQLRKTGDRPMLLRTEREVAESVSYLHCENSLPLVVQDLRRQELAHKRELAVVTEGEDSKLRNIKLPTNDVQLMVRRLVDRGAIKRREKARAAELQRLDHLNATALSRIVKHDSGDEDGEEDQLQSKDPKARLERFVRRHYVLPLELRQIEKEEQRIALDKKLARPTAVVDNPSALGRRLMRNEAGAAAKQKLVKKLLSESGVGKLDAAASTADPKTVLTRLQEREAKANERRKKLYAQYVDEARQKNMWKRVPSPLWGGRRSDDHEQ